MAHPPAADSQPKFFSAQVSEARRFFLDLAPKPRSPLAVACGGCEHCAPDYRIDRKSFPFHSVEFVARGRGSVTLGGKTRPLAPGTVFSYGPAVSQRIRTDPSDTLVKYFVDFSGRDSLGLLRRCGLAPGTVAQTSSPSELLAVFDDLVRTGLGGSALAPRICAILLELLLHRSAETSLPPGAAPPPAFATYERCRRHIQSHYQRLGSVAQAAAECHVNSAYLCRLFRRFDRQTPYNFLTRAKMQRAVERLRTPGMMVKEVAAELGFSDPFQFSRAFKGVYGVSPREFLSAPPR
jgi:AraC-like DNA-binding protein